MATHSSILAWETPRTEESGGLQSTGHKESDLTQRLNKAATDYTSTLGENSMPAFQHCAQYSRTAKMCEFNYMDKKTKDKVLCFQIFIFNCISVY